MAVTIVERKKCAVNTANAPTMTAVSSDGVHFDVGGADEKMALLVSGTAADTTFQVLAGEGMFQGAAVTVSIAKDTLTVVPIEIGKHVKFDGSNAYITVKGASTTSVAVIELP